MSQHSHNGAPRRRWLSLVCLFGVALLAVSMVGAGWMMRSNAGPQSGGPAGGGTPPALLHCIGTDVVEARAANIDLAAKLADAEVADKKLLLDKAKLALDECLVKAPAEGTVLRLGVQVGDLLGPEAKSPPLTFCPAGPRVVRAEVEQEWAGRVQDGQIATIQDDTSNGDGPNAAGPLLLDLGADNARPGQIGRA